MPSDELFYSLLAPHGNSQLVIMKSQFQEPRKDFCDQIEMFTCDYGLARVITSATLQINQADTTLDNVPTKKRSFSCVMQFQERQDVVTLQLQNNFSYQHQFQHCVVKNSENRIEKSDNVKTSMLQMSKIYFEILHVTNGRDNASRTLQLHSRKCQGFDLLHDKSQLSICVTNDQVHTNSVNSKRSLEYFHEDFLCFGKVGGDFGDENLFRSVRSDVKLLLTNGPQMSLECKKYLAVCNTALPPSHTIFEFRAAWEISVHKRMLITFADSENQKIPMFLNSSVSSSLRKIKFGVKVLLKKITGVTPVKGNCVNFHYHVIKHLHHENMHTVEKIKQLLDVTNATSCSRNQPVLETRTRNQFADKPIANYSWCKIHYMNSSKCEVVEKDEKQQNLMRDLLKSINSVLKQNSQNESLVQGKLIAFDSWPTSEILFTGEERIEYEISELQKANDALTSYSDFEHSLISSLDYDSCSRWFEERYTLNSPKCIFTFDDIDQVEYRLNIGTESTKMSSWSQLFSDKVYDIKWQEEFVFLFYDILYIESEDNVYYISLYFFLPKFQAGIMMFITFHKGHSKLQFSQLLISPWCDDVNSMPICFGEAKIGMPELSLHKKTWKSIFISVLSNFQYAGENLVYNLKMLACNNLAEACSTTKKLNLCFLKSNVVATKSLNFPFSKFFYKAGDGISGEKFEFSQMRNPCRLKLLTSSDQQYPLKRRRMLIFGFSSSNVDLKTTEMQDSLTSVKFIKVQEKTSDELSAITKCTKDLGYRHKTSFSVKTRKSFEDPRFEAQIEKQHEVCVLSAKDHDSIACWDESLIARGWCGVEIEPPYSESPEVLIYAPPPFGGTCSSFNLADEKSRFETFQIGQTRVLKFSISEYVKAGFYMIYENIIKCHSCQIEHNLSRLPALHPSEAQLHRRNCPFVLNNCSRAGVLESDGRVSDDARDPPGQQSIYIPPGEVRRESYRLSTFEHFPISSAISKKVLAKYGFYYTGYTDRVKCFACGRSVDRWEQIDNATDPRWHKPSCPMVRGLECGNIPSQSLFQATSYFHGSSQGGIHDQRGRNTATVVRPSHLPDAARHGSLFQVPPGGSVFIGNTPSPTGNARSVSAASQPPRQWRMANVISADHRRYLSNLYLNRELDRLASFARWPASRPNVAPTALAKTGFFYLGDMDRTQCFSCGGVLRNWTINDNAAAEHRSHFSQCLMVLGTETRNVPAPVQPETREERERNYPCRYPSNAHMRNEANRMDTFDRRWPIGRTAATPAEIAQAGFFYLGERDRVKCWYCNGGLQNWDYDDIPWVEHAKWFPNCQFLLQVKGQHFVYRQLSVNSHLPRPIIARQSGSAIDPPSTGEGQRQSSPSNSRDVAPSESPVRVPTPPPTIIDPQAELRKRKERIQNIMKNSEIVKSVLIMGFDSKIVEALLEDKITSGNEANPDDVYGSMTELLDDVIKKEEELKQEEQTRQHPMAASSLAMAQAGPSSFGTVSSLYSSMTTQSHLSSLNTAPGSGKYNVSYFNIDDDEDEAMDMYEGAPGTDVKELASHEPVSSNIDVVETPESLQEAINKIEEESLCKICFSSQADMVFLPCSHMCCCMECTQAIRHCPLCRVKIERAIKTYLT